jgi:hypothetical protein
MKYYANLKWIDPPSLDFLKELLLDMNKGDEPCHSEGTCEEGLAAT